jgi:prophage regulatory protein
MSIERTESLRFERLPKVCQRIGIGKSTLYAWISQGKFPAPVRLGENTVAWDARAVEGWMRKRIDEASQSQPEAK